MNITPYYNSPSNNSQNFGSNIRFVSAKEFNALAFKDFFYCAGSAESFTKSFKKGDRIWTCGIRTCTAGGIVDEEGAVGFHIYPNFAGEEAVNSNFITIIKALLKKRIKSSLVLGSKNMKGQPYSIPIFETIAKKLKKITIPSEFETFTNLHAEADVGFDKYSDSWFINANYPPNPMLPTKTVDITTLTDVKSAFKTIKIAPNDKLFANGKEVTREEAPELFI